MRTQKTCQGCGQSHSKKGIYCYDFFVPSLSLIIEYQGDYWHANPARYPSGTVLKIQHAGPVLVDDIWARDARKREEAERRGFRVAYVRESDFKKHGVEAIRCHIHDV